MSKQREKLRREVEAGRGRGGRAFLLGEDGLVALGVGERLHDVRRQRRLAGGRALEPDEPAALPPVLDELDLAEAHPRA